MRAVERVLLEFGSRGFSVLLKIDHERLAEGTKPWTVLVSGPSLGEGGYVRTDAPTIEAGFRRVYEQLRKHPGDWDWLPPLGEDS
ncbi:hypothetical protein FHX82_004621 [Amycolatopsis bartoniae]|uniref:Uncharacterized protein n=1 Tax=Amycolatopsis bartoniae TaxID=941986 RepID=A0A8H9J1A9_9PSEU|nr:hypothetical protein [Amycolatopsis bartoniae]MBB2937548.1 hypothetical protein [Amycolatopsis bartoniae]TVT05938.1 hypothetical protein FNH07_22195 [Amycolatopsis bartoniae]GHF82090.1 hypothetical protein GCM10017566_65260 [Amycolatopsis bartoniae]